MLWRGQFNAIWIGFRTEIFENFRGREILRSKSREIAPKSMPPRGAQLADDPQRSPTTMPSAGVLIANDSHRNSRAYNCRKMGSRAHFIGLRVLRSKVDNRHLKALGPERR